MVKLDSIADYSSKLLDQGNAVEAVQFLNLEVAADNIDAILLKATWCLSGYVLSRDIPEARLLLRRAEVYDHVDAALMEIALTVNGSVITLN